MDEMDVIVLCLWNDGKSVGEVVFVIGKFCSVVIGCVYCRLDFY